MARSKISSEAELRAIIEDAFERRANLTCAEIDGSTRPAVEQAISLLEAGRTRVAEPDQQHERIRRRAHQWRAQAPHANSTHPDHAEIDDETSRVRAKSPDEHRNRERHVWPPQQGLPGPVQREQQDELGGIRQVVHQLDDRLVEPKPQIGRASCRERVCVPV